MHKNQRFNKDEANHEMTRMRLDAELSHPFALKMATLICSGVITIGTIISLFFGVNIKLNLIIAGILITIFGATAFTFTYNRCI